MIKVEKQGSSSFQVTQGTGMSKPVKQKEFSKLSLNKRRRQTDQRLRDSIQMHHDRHFMQPENETCTKRFPICIVVGVNKCGTQEIVDFLHLHPHIEIYPTILKRYEMPFFNKMYNRGEEWFRDQMPCTYSNQITLMKNGLYFYDPDVPERIKRFNESIKLILMVREPVSRAVSDYMMRINLHMAHPNSQRYTMYAKNNFSSFVFNANGSDVVKNDLFVRMSAYDEPMNLWLKYFNLSQFLIMDNEEFKHDPVSALNKVEHFLWLEHFITDEMFVLNKDKGFYCVQSNISDTGMACYSENRGHQKQNVVSEETLSKLSDYFKSKNKHFFEIIGRSNDWE